MDIKINPITNGGRKLKWGIIIPIIFFLLIIISIGFSAITDINIPFITNGFNYFRDLTVSSSNSISEEKYIEHGAYYDLVKETDTKKTLIVYSGIRNIYEDNKWKRIEDAKSLKNIFGFGTIKYDSRYGYEIIDFNYTSITFIPILNDDSLLGKDVSIKKDEQIRAKFNYNSRSQRQSVTFYGNIFSSNFTVGDNSTTFSINETGGDNGALLNGNRNNANFDSIGSGQGFCFRSDGIRVRTLLNFSMSQLPANVRVLSANLSIFKNTDFGDFGVNYTFIIKNGTFELPIDITSGDASNFTGWASSGIYGGENISYLYNTSTLNIRSNTWFNISFSDAGLGELQNRSLKDFRITIINEDDILNRANPILSECMGINSPFTMQPMLFITYQVGPNLAPTFNANYPQINSTNGLNSTDDNLNAFWIANDPENTTLKANVTWFMNNITNITLKLTDYSKNTFALTFLNNSNLTKGQTWKAQINLFDGVNTTSANTSELLILNKAPTIPNINSPTNNLMTANYTINMSCSGSTDLENDPISYEFYLDRETNPPTTAFGNLTITSNVTNLNQDGTYFWRCRSNDNTSQSGFNDTRRFLVDRRIIVQNISKFNSDVFQGTNQTFSINITMNLSVAKDINATLVNNTLILTTYKEHLEDNKWRFTTSRLAPNIDTQYLWNFTILQNNNTIVYNTSYSFIQAISVHSLYDCTSGFTNSSSMLLMNYTLKNEENKTDLKGDWEGSFIRYFDDIAQNTSFTFGLKTNITNVKICSSPANASFKIDGTVRYQGLDPGTGIRLQDPRNYLFYKDNAGNSTGVLDIPLYLLDFAKANAVKFTLVDTSDVGIQNGIIKLQRYSPGNNTYETVAMGRTDQNGDTVIFLRLNDVTHKLIVVLPSGETKDYGDVVFSGSTYKITTTTISPIKKLFDFDYVTTSITFTNSTKTFSASYEDTNPSTNERITSGCFAVTRLTSNQTDNTVYNRCTLATIGTFNVYVGNGSYQYHALLYANRNPATILSQIYIDLTSNILGNNLGTEGVFFTFIITLSLVMLGLFKPEIAIAMSILGVIISVMFGFFIMTYGTLVAFIISGAMMIWRVSKR